MADGEIKLVAEIDTSKYTQGAKLIESSNDRIEKSSKEADEATKKVGSEGSKGGSKFSDAWSKAGTVLKTGLVAGAGTAATAIAGIATASTKAYAEYEQAVGGVETLFGKASGMVQKNAEQAFRTAGTSANDYMSQLNSLAATLVSSFGGDVVQAAKAGDTAMRDMSDNANKMGTDLGTIQQSYQSLARGNYAMLDNLKLGYGGTKAELQRLIEKANELGAAQGKTSDLSMENFGDVVEAIHRVQVSLGITGTTAKEAATTIEGSINMTKAAWENMLKAIAGGGDIKQAMSDLVTSAGSVITNVAPRVVEAVRGIFAALPEAISSIMASLGPVIATSLQNMGLSGNNPLVKMFQNPQPVLDAIGNVMKVVVPTVLAGFAAFKTVNIFSGITQQVNNFKTTFGTITSTVSNVGTSFTGFVNTIRGVGGATSTAGTAVKSFIGFFKANPIMLVVAALTAIGAALAVFFTQTETGRAAWQRISSAFQQVATAVMPILQQAFQTFGQIMQQVFQAIQPLIQPLLQAFQTLGTTLATTFATLAPIVMQVLTTIMQALTPLLPIITQIATTLMTALAPVIQTIGTAIAAVVPIIATIVTVLASTLMPVITQIINVVNTLLPIITTVVSSILNAVQPVIQSISQTIQGVLTVIQGVIDFITGVFTGNWSQAWEGIKTIFQGVWNTMQGLVSTIFNAIKGVIQTVLNTINSIWSNIWNGIKSVASNIWNGIKSAISNAINAVMTTITNILNAIKTTWSNIWNGIKTFAQTLWNGIKNLVSNAINAVKTTITNVINGIKNLWSNGWNAVKTTVSNVWNNIKTVVSDGVNNVINFVKSIPDKIKSFFSNAGNWLLDAGRNIIMGLVNGISNAVGDAVNAVKNAVGNVINSAKSMLGIHSPSTVFRDQIGKMIPAGVAIGVDANADEATQAVQDMANQTKQIAFGSDMTTGTLRTYQPQTTLTSSGDMQTMMTNAMLNALAQLPNVKTMSSPDQAVSWIIADLDERMELERRRAEVY